MTMRRNGFGWPALPSRRALIGTVAAAAAGTVLRDAGAGLLCAGCVVALHGLSGPAAVDPGRWPAPVPLPSGQVGHPLVTDLVTELERADKDGAALRRLARRVQLALGLAVVPQPRRVADLHAQLGGDRG
jgi:hypothetical protein